MHHPSDTPVNKQTNKQTHKAAYKCTSTGTDLVRVALEQSSSLHMRCQQQCLAVGVPSEWWDSFRRRRLSRRFLDSLGLGYSSCTLPPYCFRQSFPHVPVPLVDVEVDRKTLLLPPAGPIDAAAALGPVADS